jgi:hypothetical protein
MNLSFLTSNCAESEIEICHASEPELRTKQLQTKFLVMTFISFQRYQKSHLLYY